MGRPRYRFDLSSWSVQNDQFQSLIKSGDLNKRKFNQQTTTGCLGTLANSLTEIVAAKNRMNRVSAPDFRLLVNWDVEKNNFRFRAYFFWAKTFCLT
jgi:hypothetical protein